MLICKRNLNKTLNKVFEKGVDDMQMYYNTRDVRFLDSSKDNSLIYHFFKKPKVVFIGSFKNQFVNLTELRLYTHWQGMDVEDAIALSGSRIEYYRNGKMTDPWGKQRNFILHSQIEGLDIEYVTFKKQSIIASLLIYDGFNIYQSELVKLSLYHNGWYLNQPAGTDGFRRLSSNTNYLYNILKY